MSPSVIWSGYRIFDVLRERSAEFGDARLYVDAGTKEGRGMTLGARKLRKVLLDIGFAEGDDLRYVEDREGIHRETSWAKRLPDALRFLLAARPPTDGRARPDPGWPSRSAMAVNSARGAPRQRRSSSCSGSGTSSTSCASSRNRYASSRCSRSDGGEVGRATD